MKEALKYACKMTNQQESAELQRQLKSQSQSIDQFVQARDLLDTKDPRILQICDSLLDKVDGNSVVPGNVHALKVNYYEKEEDYQSAYSQIQVMMKDNVDPEKFLDNDTIHCIYSRFGKQWRNSTSLSDDSDSLDDSIDDDLDDVNKEE